MGKQKGWFWIGYPKVSHTYLQNEWDAWGQRADYHKGEMPELWLVEIDRARFRLGDWPASLQDEGRGDFRLSM